MPQIIIIVSVVLIVLGIIFGGIGLAISGGLSTGSKTVNTYTVEEDFESISIKADTGDILVKPSEDGTCRVDCRESKKEFYTIENKNGELSIEYHDTRKWYEYIQFSFNFEEIPDVVLYLPGQSYKNLAIDASTSDIELSRGIEFENASISISTGDLESYAKVSDSFTASVSTGNIEIEGADSKAIKVTATTGDVSVENIKDSSELSVQTNTGDIEISDIETGMLKLESTTGDQEIENISCESLNSIADTGERAFENIKAIGEVSVLSDTGEVRFDALNAGSISIVTDTGDITLKNSLISGKASITASTGDVRIIDFDASEMKIITSTGDVTGNVLTPKIFYTHTSTGSVNVPKSTEGGLCDVETSTGDIRISIGK